MEYQKIENLIDDTPNQHSKFRYSDGYILVKGTIAINNAAAADIYIFSI